MAMQQGSLSALLCYCCMTLCAYGQLPGAGDSFHICKTNVLANAIETRQNVVLHQVSNWLVDFRLTSTTFLARACTKHHPGRVSARSQAGWLMIFNGFDTLASFRGELEGPPCSADVLNVKTAPS